MPETNFPGVGDILMSDAFAYGYRDSSGSGVIYIDGVSKERLVQSFVGEEERVEEAARTGVVPPNMRTMDYGAYDPSRAHAKYVVEEAGMQGGSGPDARDPYPDGWYVKARRLKDDGAYDPSAETIGFYLSGCFIGMLDPAVVHIVGKMQQTVSFSA